MADYKIDYDTEASGPFTEGEILTFGGGGATAELVILYDNGTTGEMYVAMISGSPPADNATIAGGTSSATAAVNGTPFLSRFPVKIRDDISKNSGNDIRWTGPDLGATHSCKYDAESGGPFVVNEIITFGNGSTAELITLVDDGTTGEIFVRMISEALPTDNATITGGTSGCTAAVNGAFHIRAYTPSNIHYWFLDKGDDATFVGNDVHDRTRPQVSRRIGTTDVQLLGTANIDDATSYRLYGGSLSQGGSGSETEYNAIAISVVDVDGETQPVIIQNNALHSTTTTQYWKNAYMPNAASRINLLIKVRSAGTIIDRRVVRFRALEYGRNYFTAPDPTMGSGITPVSLVATNDGNNGTLAATVAGYTDAVFAFGFATVDHNNGNGPEPYWAVGDLGARTKAQFYERSKWLQRRGTSSTVFGLNAQLIVGNDLNIPYDTEASGPFTEGETITWTGGSALLLALDDQGTTGTLYCQRLTGDAPANNAALAGATSSATAAVNGTATTRLIINNLVGSFTGSDFNPANAGISLEAADATSGDLFTDLLGAQQQPPNNRSGSVNTAVGNTITASPYDGVSLDAVGDPEPDFDYLELATALTGGSEVSVVVDTSIPSWVPQSGNLRITTNSGLRRLLAYSSWSGSTFSIASTSFTGDNASIANGVMPQGIDQVAVSTSTSFTGIYSSDIDFVIRVSNGSSATPKRPATTTAVFGAGGFSVNVTLQDD